MRLLPNAAVLLTRPGAASAKQRKQTIPRRLQQDLWPSFLPGAAQAPIFFARSLANVEAIIGQLYPATLLARLVTLELEGRRSRKGA